MLRSEHDHLAQLWDDAPRPQRLLLLALADEPARRVDSADDHARGELPASPTLQTALRGLVRREIVGRDEGGDDCLLESFLVEWLRREAF